MVTDAIIVLANLMDASGRLNDESAARAAVAATLFRQLSPSVLVTTGWAYRSDSDIRIADAFRDHIACAHGVPFDRIVADPHARDTVGDAYFTNENLIKPRRWKHVSVVTSDYHTARTAEIFQFICGPAIEIAVHGAPARAPANIDETERLSLEAFRKTFEGVASGDSAAILERLRERHPFYNGVVYPRL